MRNRWVTFSDFLAQYFPAIKVQKITLNAGFTCPTRDGSRGRGGCTYCNNKSFSPAHNLKNYNVTEQLKTGIDFFRHKYPSMKYIAYFQAYTNTYGDVKETIKKYEEALAYPDIVGLIIGTRPDCMPNELLDYLEQLNNRTFLMIEYGIESTIDKTLERIQRGHTYAQSVDAVCRTAERGILVGAHLILGLPGEDKDDLLSHASRLNKLPIKTLKIHQLQIIKGTLMEQDYLKNPEEYHLFNLEEYIDLCINFLDKLREDIIIERFVSQAPSGLLVAPAWGLKNHVITDKILKRIKSFHQK